jgi:hypothetical protein
VVDVETASIVHSYPQAIDRVFAIRAYTFLSHTRGEWIIVAQVLPGEVTDDDSDEDVSGAVRVVAVVAETGECLVDTELEDSCLPWSGGEVLSGRRGL